MLIRFSNPEDIINNLIIENKILVIENEVKKIIEELNKIIGNENEIEGLTFGWKIFYSPIIINAKILFIGINPGTGDAGEPFTYYDEEYEVLEYIDTNRNKYTLARNTVKIFDEMNLPNLLNEAVKINTKFYSTKGVSELHKFEKYLLKKHLTLYNRLVFFNKKWIRDIIEIINPVIIICEGREAFDYMDNLYDDIDNWTQTLDYNSNKICGCFKRKSDGMYLFGYSRQQGLNSYSFISKELIKIL
jgi:uracil-DNA glycosylase